MKGVLLVLAIVAFVGVGLCEKAQGMGAKPGEETEDAKAVAEKAPEAAEEKAAEIEKKKAEWRKEVQRKRAEARKKKEEAAKEGGKKLEGVKKGLELPEKE